MNKLFLMTSLIFIMTIERNILTNIMTIERNILTIVVKILNNYTINWLIFKKKWGTPQSYTPKVENRVYQNQIRFKLKYRKKL